jgi:hypothetical protein
MQPAQLCAPEHEIDIFRINSSSPRGGNATGVNIWFAYAEPAACSPSRRDCSPAEVFFAVEIPTMRAEMP